MAAGGKSVLLAPYWLDGHYISAQTAHRLGYTAVADAIRDEVVSFLGRLPALADLLFNDHTPFVSEKTKQWLANQPGNQSAPVIQVSNEDIQAARLCFDEQGLEAALRYLDTLPAGEPATSSTGSILARSLWKRRGWYSLRNSSTGCCSGWDCR